MISIKAKSLALDLQAVLTAPEQNGLAIHRGILDLCEELGGSRLMAEKLFTPIAQCFYLMTLLVQRVDNAAPFKLLPQVHAGAGDTEPGGFNEQKPDAIKPRQT